MWKGSTIDVTVLIEQDKVKAVLDSAAFESETTPHHKCGISVTQMDTIFDAANQLIGLTLLGFSLLQGKLNL